MEEERGDPEVSLAAAEAAAAAATAAAEEEEDAEVEGASSVVDAAEEEERLFFGEDDATGATETGKPPFCIEMARKKKSRKSVRWSAVPVLCLSKLCSK